MIDIDALFEKYFRDFVMKNVGKMTEDEIENEVGKKYDEFGDIKLNELKGLTPKQYFSSMSDVDLAKYLSDCFENNIPVCDYLCNEIQNRKSMKNLLISLFDKDNEELSTYVVNLLNNNVDEQILSSYVDVIVQNSAGESVLESITDVLCENANKIKDKIIDCYLKYPNSKKYLIEIISNILFDDRAFDILLKEFNANEENIAINAMYLARFGDDRALPSLYKMAEKDNLSYVDFKEIKNAVECLGGELETKKDYSFDKDFKKLQTKFDN